MKLTLCTIYISCLPYSIQIDIACKFIDTTICTRYYATATERVHKLYTLYIEVRVLLPHLQSLYHSLKVPPSAQSQPQTPRVPNALSDSPSSQCVPYPNLQLRPPFAHALSHRAGV